MIKERAGALIARFLHEDEDGATAIEYGLIAALLALALVGTMSSMSEAMSGTYQKVDAALAD